MKHILTTIIRTSIPYVFNIIKEHLDKETNKESKTSNSITYTTKYWRDRYYQQLYINSIKNGKTRI